MDDLRATHFSQNTVNEEFTLLMATADLCGVHEHTNQLGLLQGPHLAQPGGQSAWPLPPQTLAPHCSGGGLSSGPLCRARRRLPTRGLSARAARGRVPLSGDTSHSGLTSCNFSVCVKASLQAEPRPKY